MTPNPKRFHLSFITMSDTASFCKPSLKCRLVAALVAAMLAMLVFSSFGTGMLSSVLPAQMGEYLQGQPGMMGLLVLALVHAGAVFVSGYLSLASC